MRTRGLLPALALLVAACGGAPAPPGGTIRLATTTSTRDSGLLDAILPLAERDTGVRIEVLAVGSGQALRIGKDGDADLLLVHDPEGEEEFVRSGEGLDRRTFMFNDFVIAGPPADPAAVRGLADAKVALLRIAASGIPFLSRGDDSGTHRKERRLWKAAGAEPGGAWYRETGQGMGATLSMAAEVGGYVLADRATLAAHRDAARLPVLVEGDPELRNPYSLLLVNPARHPHAKSDAARKVEDWLAGPAGRRAIEGFRAGGRQVFFFLGGD